MSLFTNDQTMAFDDLVGEGKKYKTNDDAAKAIFEKDRFIEQLKSEAEEFRKELQSRSAVDKSQEILDRLDALRKEPVTEGRLTTEPERTEVKGLSVEDVDKLLQARERKAQENANIAKVKAALEEEFGDQYDKALKSIGEKNGLTPKALDELAAQAPQLVLNLINGVVKKDVGFTPPNSSLSTGFVPTSGNIRTRSYYNKMKETDRTKYFSAEVRAQQYKDAMSLGDAFEDT